MHDIGIASGREWRSITLGLQKAGVIGGVGFVPTRTVLVSELLNREQSATASRRTAPQKRRQTRYDTRIDTAVTLADLRLGGQV
jgi:hypothetical protein